MQEIKVLILNNPILNSPKVNREKCAVLNLEIPSYRDKAGNRANKNADAQENREDLAEVVYVISEQAHSAENGSDFRVHPNDNRIENNHRYQS